MDKIYKHKAFINYMKITITQLMFIVLFVSVSFAHDLVGQEVLDQKMSIGFSNENLKTALAKIEQTSKVKFVFNPKEIKTNQKISIQAKEEKLKEILTKLLDPLKIKFELSGNRQIILSKQEISFIPNQMELPDIPTSMSFAESISGNVIDENDEPLVGVNIQIKGTTKGTSSDVNGDFKITVPNKKSILVFTFIGYNTKEILVGNQTIIKVILSPDEKTLNEVVVVGYATTNRKDILGSVGSIKEKQIIQTTPVNAFDAVQGRMAGVQINSLGGPGEGSSIRIRGVSTFEGGSSPLFIVDGQQLEDINNLNPNDIASMEVLKDGASAAIYGSKSANGVVIITTKSGKSDDMKLNVDYSHVINTLASNLPLANTKQRFIYENVRSGRDPDALTVQDTLSELYQYSPDVQAYLYKPSSRNQLNLSLSGGKKGLSLYWNNAFLDEQGTIINTSFQRFSTRLKVDSDVKKRISASTTLNLSYDIKKGLNEGSVFEHLIARIPYFPLFEPDGSYSPEIAGRQNPLAEAAKTRRDSKNYRMQSLSFIQVNIIKGLTFKSTLGVNFRLMKNNNFDPTIVQTIGRPAIGSEGIDLSFDYQQENFFTYRKKKGAHNFTGILGNQVQRWVIETTDLRAIAFSSDNIETFNNVSQLNLAETNTGKSAHSLTGYFSSLSYDFKSRYLINGTLRRDGSSRFGLDNRYGFFPSGSIGWRISNEKFMKGLKSTVDNLLIKASYGTNGNERIGDYNSLLLYSPGAYYGGVNTINITQLSNPNLGWESTQSINLGLNATLLKSKLNVEVDFWRKKTSDLLYNVPLPKETGFRTIKKNIGSIQNEGIDITLSGTPFTRKKFSWNADLNITLLRNKVLELADGTQFESGAFLIKEGEPLGNIFGFKNLGIFTNDQSNAFTSDGKQLTPVFDESGKFSKYTLEGADYTGKINQIKLGSRTLAGGDIQWADLNNDFQIDGQNDRMVLGNGTSKYFGGLNNDFTYKNLTLSILIDYNFGNDIYRQYDFLRNDLNSANETPAPNRIDNSWRKQGDVAPFASLDRARTNNAFGPNSQYISKGDYIRWRSIRFNYTLPSSLYKKAKWVTNISANFSVNNLLTFTNYPGYNPDLGSTNALQTGYDTLKYPNRRDFIMGLRFQL